MSAREQDADGTFLGRWSRRKRGGAGDAPPPECAGAPVGESVDASAEPAGAAGTAPTDTPSEPPGVPGPSGPPEPTDADMPPLESLNGTSDVSAFLSRGVSASLRRAALRRVFRAPEFNVRDGLNDYDGDFTAFAPLGDTITCDMKFRTARLEREAAEREARELEMLERDAPAAPEGDEPDAAPEEAAADDAGASPVEASPEDLAGREPTHGPVPDDAATAGRDRRDADDAVHGAGPPAGAPPA